MRTGSEYRAATVLLLPGAIVPVRRVTGLLAGAWTLRALSTDDRPVPSSADTTTRQGNQFHVTEHPQPTGAGAGRGR
ncbi:hypothetical protein ACIQ6K_29685 [Streptomyces sp. NPDC096354]|uniref:hypothetical protein n=1 Tax=Streptomyces sp. NPDC096354 TaxID=3366088 RepID=UPI0038068C5B